MTKLVRRAGFSCASAEKGRPRTVKRVRAPRTRFPRSRLFMREMLSANRTKLKQNPVGRPAAFRPHLLSSLFALGMLLALHRARVRIPPANSGSMRIDPMKRTCSNCQNPLTPGDLRKKDSKEMETDRKAMG